MIITHSHAVLDIFIFNSVLFSGITIRARRDAIIGHVFEVMRSSIRVVVLVFHVSNEITVATVLDDVVLMV